MNTEKLKNLPARESIHSKIVACAKSRGMTIQGLHERILRAWLDENFLPEKLPVATKDIIRASK